MKEALPRWKLFPREIECDLSLHHHVDIGDWHRGVLSSRRLLTLLDGLPTDCWYKLSLQKYWDDLQEESHQAEVADARSIIFAMLHGQKIEVDGG